MSRETESSQTKPGTHVIALAISRQAYDALAEGVSGEGSIDRRLQGAVRLYLADKGTGRPAWPYPSFLRGSENAAEVPLEIEFDPPLASAFEAEAGEQSISPSQLAEHAAFYFAAEVDAGRVTQRILEDPSEADQDNSLASPPTPSA